MFRPQFKITPKTAKALMKIEAAKEAVGHLPLTDQVQAELRETAKLLSTHYSTKIEGNRLTLEEAEKVVRQASHFPGRERDEKEVLGYYSALDQVQRWVAEGSPLDELKVQRLHAMAMAGGKTRVKPTPYRDGQNVIRDSRSGAIVYLPPEAKDVPPMMEDLFSWLSESKEVLPAPVLAAIAHYQFATVHPYYDGNGRTARLLATLILHQEGYDLKGFYSLEEYYGRNLAAYYRAIAVGPSHNYYLGRADADISAWVEYFCMGMAEAFEAVQSRATKASAAGESAPGPLYRTLDVKQRKVLVLFRSSETITAHDVAKLFGLQPRTARVLCAKWVSAGYIQIIDAAKKTRKYRLHPRYEGLITAV